MRFLILMSFLSLCSSANILVIFPFTSKSHYMMLRPIGLELARRGHNVTVITPFRETQHPPTYHQVMVEDKKIWDALGNGGRPNVFETVNFWFSRFQTEVLWKGGLFCTETALNSPEVQQFLEKDNYFDIVIAELFYQEALTMLAHKYGAPLVYVTTYGNSMRSNFLLRNPLQMATTYHEFGTFEEPYSFYSRLKNLLFLIYELFGFYTWYLPQQEYLAQKYLKDLSTPVPTLEEIHKNASLFLYNSHISLDPPVAYYQNIVEIGGIHMYMDMTLRKLPKELQQFLDNATDGVVYVSFGSNVHSSELPAEKKDAFLKVFGSLKQKVLWKWEDGNLTGKPDNVLTRSWMPQREILSHPNVRVFISHGGLIGTQEAVFRAVPMLGIPIYCDQYNNLLHAEQNGYGTILQYKDLNQQTLQSKLNRILNDKSFKENAKMISDRFKDRPSNPLDTAVYWIEYVMRNKGADYMKPMALKLSWIAWSMLDVYLFTFAILAIIIMAVIFVIRFLTFGLFSDNNRKRKKKNQ